MFDQQYFSHNVAVSFAGGGNDGVHREKLGQGIDNPYHVGCESNETFFVWYKIGNVIGYSNLYI